MHSTAGAIPIETEQAASPPSKGELGFARSSRRIPAWSVSITLAIVLLGVLEILASAGLVSAIILPAPSAVVLALFDGTVSGIFGPSIVSTVTATLIGFTITTGLALAVAGILSSVPYLERVMVPFIVAFQTLPKIAVAPLIILWLGFGQEGKVVIVGIVCFFPILVNTLQGLKLRDRDRYELFHSLGASRWHILRYLRLPSAVPYIFAGLHIGLIFALIGAVTAEFVGSRDGLGYVLMQNKAAFNVPGVFAVLVLFMVVGHVLDATMRVVERRFSHWTAEVSKS